MLAVCTHDHVQTTLLYHSGRRYAHDARRYRPRPRVGEPYRLCLPKFIQHNLFPGLAKSLAFRKPFDTRSTITFDASLCKTHGLPGVLYSATAFQHKFYNLTLSSAEKSDLSGRKRHEITMNSLYLLTKIILTGHKQL